MLHDSMENKSETLAIRLVPNVGTHQSFVFDVMDRSLIAGGSSIKLGRYSDRAITPDRISFESKVVSRFHAEIWVGQDKKLYIKDTCSSSGTFVNHVRLSPANSESLPQALVDGDLVQLGVDYKGGLEPMYRAVKIRLEVNPGDVSSAYQIAAFQNFRNRWAGEVQECCICLYCIAPLQALFVAPCSHVYHYRCLRPLLQNYPGFSCPLCRTYSNLEDSVAVEEDEVLQMLGIDEGETRSGGHQREKTVFEENQEIYNL